MEAQCRAGLRLTFAVLLLWAAGLPLGGQQAAEPAGPEATGLVADSMPAPMAQWFGRTVRHIEFAGVSSARLAALAGHLAQQEGAPLSRDGLRESLRQLYATGLFTTIQAEAVDEPEGLRLIFRGAPAQFVGIVSVAGAKGATLNTQLERATRLEPGARFTQAKLDYALEQMRSTLADNGFHQPVITPKLTPHPEEQLVDIAFDVVSGPQARVGEITVSGDAGMTAEQLSTTAHLRSGAHVDRDTSNHALEEILKHYQHESRLAAEVKLAGEPYVAKSNTSNFEFTANRGPVVTVRVIGANPGEARIRKLIPIFEEGSVDDDLLNEGNRRVRNYYQSLGYFDVKVDHQEQAVQQGTDSAQVVITYTVDLGPRRRVEKVTVTGNHYFDSGTLEELLSVHAANTLDRHGAYSQALVASDVSALESVYRNNGFSAVKVSADVAAPDAQLSAQQSSRPAAPFQVIYRIEEGTQTRVGTVRLEGAQHMDAQKLALLLNTQSGQLLSPQNLAGDRDALLTEYLSRGFDHAQVTVQQQADPGNPALVDVVFHIAEGPQIFVRKVLLTGLSFTRPDTVARAITIHAGDPLDPNALQQTQRNLYDFALFNEIDTAIENPYGDEVDKTVLLQATEARRWSLTYGFGFEAQTGTPQYNCGGIVASGVSCNPQGKTGVSPRVLLDISRNNLLGREQSISLRGTYGLLEQKIDLLFQNPHFNGGRDLGLSFSGGYANSLDVSTYVASKLEGSMRWTERFNAESRFSKANTLIYEFDFRRVKVQASSLQVYPDEIEELATAVRVGGPAVTWIRDTRDSPLDAHRGSYLSFQDFLSSKSFAAEVQFNRLDLTSSSYYSFDKGRFVLARNTRYGQERAFGSGSEELIPLPERLYAGGATSLRGFGTNSAGPRDPETGYPIGGAGALINSTEMRLPPPLLPWVGDSVSFVLFHDMGNVFTNAGDAWASVLRFNQPNRSGCAATTTPTLDPIPSGPMTSTGKQGTCNFNYFSQTPGVGLRYHTPVGPVRLDFSYNLNPPIYPVNIDNSANPIDANPHVGEGSHFNFFFSLGQTF